MEQLLDKELQETSGGYWAPLLGGIVIGGTAVAIIDYIMGR